MKACLVAGLICASIAPLSALQLVTLSNGSDDTVFHYMRIPKTGSSTFFLMLNAAQAKGMCQNVVWHNHQIFPEYPHVRKGQIITVVRNPCERFVSQWGYTLIKFSRWVDECHDGFGDNALAALHASPIAWGNFLLQNGRSGDVYNWMNNRSFVFHRGVCKAFMLLLHQAQWVTENTFTACLPDALSEMNAYFASQNANCVLEELPKKINAETMGDYWKSNPQVCDIAKRLYPDDVQLWNARCGQKFGVV